MRLQVKICCISSIAEAEMAIEAGASVLGLVGPMPSGPGIISDALIAEIAGRVPRHIETFLLSSETTAEAIIAHQRRVGTSGLQIVDALAGGSYEEIRAALPGVRIIQVIHVTGPASLEEAVRVSPYVDALLLDSGNPALAVKELGGTGRIHDWALSRQIREAVQIPLFLAGGLRAENVRQALDLVGPQGVDLCSGVRSAGKLDPEKLQGFFAALESENLYSAGFQT